MRAGKYLAYLAIMLTVAGLARATEYTVDPAESIFAVVTHKAGIAARFAHNHLVYPGEYTATLSAESDDPEATRFSLSFPVDKLQVDAPDLQKKWYSRIEAAGILDEPFKEVDEKDRQTIVEHMRNKEQLDAVTYSEISAKVTQVRAKPQRAGTLDYTHTATLEFTVHGKAVERECPASITISNGTITVEAQGRFTFTEFGIKPYSAMAGAVKNRDAFHVYVHVVAKAKS